MKIIKREEPSTSLTYRPFENIGELLEKAPRKEDSHGNDKHSTSNGQQ